MKNLKPLKDVVAVYKANGIRPLDSPEYGHQCAIRMSKCLKKFGVFKPKDYKAQKNHVDESSGLALRAEELFLWLSQHSTLGKPSTVSVEKSPKGTGLVYLRDSWAREGQKDANRTGDHIDFFMYYSAGARGRSLGLGLACWVYQWGVSEELWKGCKSNEYSFWPWNW